MGQKAPNPRILARNDQQTFQNHLIEESTLKQTRDVAMTLEIILRKGIVEGLGAGKYAGAPRRRHDTHAQGWMSDPKP